MIRKLITFCLLGLSAVLVSCDNENNLTPSMKDVDRLPGLLDLNNPTVKKFHDDYGVNILYKFNDTLDFKFQLLKLTDKEKWDYRSITHATTEEEIAAVFKYANEMVFDYMDDNFRKLLPGKILLAKTFSLGSSENPDKYNVEVFNPESLTSTACSTPYAFLLTFNESVIKLWSDINYKQSRNHKLYTMICYVIDKHKLYDDVPDEFFSPVSDYYGKNIYELARLDSMAGKKIIPWSAYYPASWYLGKGLALTPRSPNANAISAGYDSRITGKSATLMVPSRERDFRNFIALILFESEANLTTYYKDDPVLAARMKIAIEALDRWGIKVKDIALAPNLYTMFNVTE